MHTPATPPDDTELLLAAASELLMLIDANSLEIRAANPRCCHELGYTPEQLIGQPISEHECALSDLFFWEEMAQLAADDEKTSESSLRRADCTVFDVIKSVRRIDSPSGKRYALRATPIAQQKQIEHDLAHLGLRLRATLEATADGILFVDCDGHILNMNRRFSDMWKLTAEILLNHDDKTIFRHMASQLAPASGLPLPACVSRDDALEERFDTLRLVDGRVFERNIGIARESEQIIGRVISYRDVTERHRTQQELLAANEEVRRASRAKGDFLAMMSHEIRTPLNAIIGINELMLDGQLATAQRDYALSIASSAEALLVIINDILDFSKIEAGRLEIEHIPFDLHTLLNDIIQFHTPRTRDKGLNFKVEISPDVPSWIVSDPTRLRQIVTNFLSNAIKFTAHGEVALHVDQLPPGATPRLRLSIRDNGIGMSPETQSRLFSPFTQADSSTTRRFGGTGLGLAITRQLLQLLGGEIQLQSTEGQGSTFTALLPLIAANAPAANTAGASTAMAATATEIAARGSVRLLLVEDNPTNQVVAIGTLRKLGYTDILIANNGQEALDAVRQYTFDALLMDCQMPVMDGYTATSELRAHGCTLPIIAMTANAMQGDREKCFAVGMNDFVPKPIRRAELAAALSRWVTPSDHPVLPNTQAAPLIIEAPLDSPLVFARKKALALYDGDENLLNLVVAAFIDDTPETLEKLHAALASQDAHHARIHVHGIKGAAASAGAEAVRATALAMEKSAHDGQLEQTARLLPLLEQQFDEFKQATGKS
ncbi:MAG: response regulator [Sterolibacterium sp.]|nr:response regulator [Sterolibacterium sp.]